MIPLLEPPEPHDFLLSYRQACEKAGLNYTILFDYYFTHEYVFKGPDYLLMGGPDPQRGDAWHVHWAETTKPNRALPETIAHFLSLMPYERPYVSWSRALRGDMRTRYYLTKRLRALTARGQPVPPA